MILVIDFFQEIREIEIATQEIEIITQKDEKVQRNVVAEIVIEEIRETQEIGEIQEIRETLEEIIIPDQTDLHITIARKSKAGDD